MRHFLKWLSIPCSVLASHLALAQGCSDAGFCTMGAMRPNQLAPSKMAVKLRSLEIANNIGYTKFKDVIVNNVIEMNIGISNSSFFQVKMPYTYISGPLANTQGLGDVSLSYTFSKPLNEQYAFGLSLGTKIPTNKADKSRDGLPLPMYYQTSLGTYDLILGVSAASSKWLFAFGYQMPVYTLNANDFRWAPWNSTLDSAAAGVYPRSSNLKRGNDIMFRVERNFRFSRLNFFIGILPIYRLTQDIVNFSLVNRDQVPESNGLVINGLAGIGYQFSVRSGIKLLIGVKLTDRYTNPDGLSREFVTNLSYVYRF